MSVHAALISKHETRTRDAMTIVVGNIWAEYLPGTFVDSHASLRAHEGFESFNLVENLHEGAQPPDDHTLGHSVRSSFSPAGVGLAERIRRRLTEPLRRRRFVDFCVQAIEKYDVSVIHAHFGTTAARTVGIVEQTGRPGVVSLYGVDASATLRDPAWREPYRRMYDTYSRFLVLSEVVRDRLVADGCPNGKISVFNLPAQIERYPYREGGTDGPVRFVTAARFVEKKGYDLLIPAFARLVEDGTDATLTAIGYGTLKGQIEGDIERLGLRDRVRLQETDLAQDFHELFYSELEGHDIFVLPSVAAPNGDDEGGPSLCLVCAQAAGLPVVCTRFPGSEISVVEDVNGLYCGETVDSLFETMRRLAKRPEDWTPMGEDGRRRVVEQFSEQDQNRILREIYTDLADSS